MDVRIVQTGGQIPRSIALMLASLAMLPAGCSPDAQTPEANADPFCGKSPQWEEHPDAAPLKTTTGQDLGGGDPFVLLDDGIYKMWRTRFIDGVLGTAYAESEDGLRWDPLTDAEGNQRLVLAPTPGSWDRNGIETVTVVKKDGLFWLWYLGYPNGIPDGEGRTDAIGLATSSDGITWMKTPEPVLTPELSWEQPFQRTGNENGEDVTFWEGGLQEPSVIWDETEGVFKMWYAAKFYDDILNSGRSFVGFRIGYATSPDGASWTKNPSPVFEPTGTLGTFDPVATSHTDVIKDARFGYHLFYAGGGAIDSIGHAFSADGLQWERDPANPIISGQTSNDEEQDVLIKGEFDQAVGGPSVLFKDGSLYLYYMRSEPSQSDFAGLNTLGMYSALCDASETDTSPPSQEATVVADFAQPVDQASMSGFLSGILDDSPDDDLILPLKPFLIRGDSATAAVVDGVASPIARYDLFDGLGSWYVLMVSNIWGYPPTNFRDNGPPTESLDAFRDLVTGLAETVRDNNLPRVVFDVWNEPDADQFSPGDEDDFNQVYLTAERAIHAVLPTALVAGPTLSWYDADRIQRFLDFCLETGCEVNVVSWHELLSLGTTDEPGADIAEVADHLKAVRQTFFNVPKYATLNLQQIHINEYGGRPDQYRPGETVAYLSALELGGADAAAKACWSRNDESSANCSNGSLDGLFAPESRDALAPWWVYAAYAEAVDGRVSGVSEDPRLAVLAGLTSSGEAQLLVGHTRLVGEDQASPASVVLSLSHLDDAMSIPANGRARVQVERIPDADETPVSSPLSVVFDREFQLDGGTIAADVGTLALHEAFVVRVSNPQ